MCDSSLLLSLYRAWLRLLLAPAEPPAPHDSPRCCARLQQGLWELLLSDLCSAVPGGSRDAPAKHPPPLPPLCNPSPGFSVSGASHPVVWDPAVRPRILPIAAARLCSSCFFPGFPLCRSLGMVQSSLQRPWSLRGCC